MLRVRGQGVAADGTGSKGKRGGDLLVTIDVQVPDALDEHQREVVESLAGAFEADPRAELFAKQRNRRSSDG